MNLNTCMQIMRMNKPIGSLLLWYPVAWALWLANHGAPSLPILFLFLSGTIIMRSAGCVINDYFDKDLDPQVQRTSKRPLASGIMQPTQALMLFTLLLLLACTILIFLPITCTYYALIAVSLTAIYPLCKRFIHAPQLILSLAFSSGIPIVYAACNHPITWEVFFLVLVNILWVVSYDTIYAMADKKDDMRAGIKSTAVYFGEYDQIFVKALQVIMHFMWFFWAIYYQMHVLFYCLWFMALCNLFWQQKLIRRNAFIEAFKTNNFYGLLMWLAIIFGLGV